MVTISLCMIVKNEEAVLARCLSSIAPAVDEVIVVDTGSSDRTKEIARAFTDKVYDFAWVDDFSAARNCAYDHATMDYQMWLDADDVMPEGERDKLIALKETLPREVDMVTMKYHTHFDENGLPVMTSTRERLTRRTRRYRWRDPVHECIPLAGNIRHTDIAIHHKKPAAEGASTRNLDIYLALERSGKALSPRQMYYFARELSDHGRYAQAAYYFGRFLDEKKGWLEDNIAACFALAICHRQLGDEKSDHEALVRSFDYAPPRAEILTELGYHARRSGDIPAALAWFMLAAQLEKPDSMGFVLEDYWGYIPNIECCVCLSELGRVDEAIQYNRRAAAYKPDSAAVKHNEAYLNQILTGAITRA